MSSQLSDLIFFHLLYTSHDTPDERVGNRHESGNLIDQVDCTTYVWSYSKDRPDCLRLIMPKFFFGSTSCFHITGTLQSLDLNGSSNRK